MAAALPGLLIDELKGEAVAHVPGHASGARLSPLQGGAVNKSFIVETAAGRFVLKIHAPLGLVLGVDHIREARLQNAAAAAGVAPEVVHVDPRQRFMISRYVPGRRWCAADLANPEKLRQLGAAFRDLHALQPAVPAPFDMAALLRYFATQIARAAPAESGWIASQMARADVSLHECGTDARTPALFHSDPHYSNILESEGKVVLLDWEYAAVGDPLYDLACALAYHPEALPHASDLLEASGLGDQASLAMLEHATTLYSVLNTMWEKARCLAAVGAGVRVATPAD